MPTTVVNSVNTDGYLSNASVTYATARSGGGSFSLVSSLTIGQWLSGGVYSVFEGFLNFDLLGSGIPAAAVISAVAFRLYCSLDATTTDFTVQLRTQNWGPSLSAADWVAGGSIGGTLLATLATSGLTASTYNTFSLSGTALKDACTTALAGDGIVRCMLNSDRTVSNTAPSDSERAFFRSRSAGIAGTYPELELTYTVPYSATRLINRTLANRGIVGGGLVA